MKPSRLSDQDRQECDEAFQAAQKHSSGLPALRLRIFGFAVLLIVCIGGEYCLGYSVAYDALGPLPGEPWSPVPGIVALSGMIAMLAFSLYKRAHAESPPVRFVNGLAGYVALSFIILMGVMLAKLIYTNMSGADVGANLFGNETVPASASFLERLFEQVSGPFALIFGALTICNLYVAEYALGGLMEAVKKLLEGRALANESRTAMDEIEECERELARLDVQQQEILRGLEPRAAYEFANELSCVIAEALSPIEQWITAQQLRKKPPASVLSAETETSIDIAKLRERVAALTLDAKVIYASFSGENKGKNP